MRVFDVEQGSPEWCKLRMGIPTASAFDRILTPGGKPSKQAEAYRHHLIAEMFLGRPIDAPKTSWMERGSEMEGEAVCWYEFERDVAVQTVGFVTDDDMTVGCSPDRLVGDDGLLEIKCPSPAVHVEYLLWGGVDDAYKPQLQGQMLVTGRDWVDIVSYHPEMPCVAVRVPRDDAYCASLADALVEFNRLLEAEKQRLVGLGHKFKGRF